MQELINKLWTLKEHQLILVNDFINDLLNPKKKRSLTQNSYSWVLQTELANKLRISKEELHFEMLKHYGQREMVSMLSDINPEGYFDYYEKVGKGEVNGKQFTHYYVYKRSKDMNSYEFSILLEGIIRECEQQGIATLTDEEIKKMRLI